MKALKNLGPKTLDQPQSIDEEVRPATHKKHKNEDHMCFVPEEATTNQEKHCREGDALAILKQHEIFMESQVKLASQHVELKANLQTVSSKRPSTEEADKHYALENAGMEGKGPRTVSKVVKNYRKRLKKKRSKGKPGSCLPQSNT